MSDLAAQVAHLEEHRDRLIEELNTMREAHNAEYARRSKLEREVERRDRERYKHVEQIHYEMPNGVLYQCLVEAVMSGPHGWVVRIAPPPFTDALEPKHCRLCQALREEILNLTGKDPK